MSDVADTLAEHLRAAAPEAVASAYLYGSEASGRAHRESDVDIGVVFDRDVLAAPDERSEAAADVEAAPEPGVDD